MNQTATAIKTQTLSLARVFNAPREKVFQAWTDPQTLQKWFGPEGVNTVKAEVDLRVGGGYRFLMQEPPIQPPCVDIGMEILKFGLHFKQANNAPIGICGGLESTLNQG